MTAKNRETVDACIAELEKHGAEILREEWDHPHPGVYFRWKGETRFYVCSLTASDRKVGFRVRQNIRHILGVVKTGKTVGERREPRDRAPAREIQCPAITVRSDPMAALANHPLAGRR